MKSNNWTVLYSLFLMFTLYLPVNGNAQGDGSEKSVGNWSGTLDVQGTKLTLVFKITRSDNSSLTATMDVPQQGASNLPVSKTFVRNDSLYLMVDMIQGSFRGTFKNGQSVEGTWNQRGISLPLTLTRSEGGVEIKRPQTPEKPYPYKEESVVYENKTDGIKLAGTLTIPAGSGKFPAVVLITGSGAQDRDETIFGHKPFLVLADFLTRNGIAVLRSDDRGVGGSGGSMREMTSEDLAGDALAGVEFLKNQSQIDVNHIGLIGHSEGGIIAPIAANRSNDVAFIVLWAGMGIPGDQILYKQAELINKAEGVPEAQIEQNHRLQEAIFNVIRQEKDSLKTLDSLRIVLSGGKYSQLNASQQKAIDQQAEGVNSPWFRYFLNYDPYPALTKVKCPVLAMIGEKDLQVPAKENLAAIKKALTEGGNKNFRVLEMKNLNHLFQNCTTGSVSEYGKIEETIAPAAMDTIKNWILSVVQ